MEDLWNERFGKPRHKQNPIETHFAHYYPATEFFKVAVDAINCSTSLSLCAKYTVSGHWAVGGVSGR